MGKKKATAKGINASTKDEVITHEDYITSLFQKEQIIHKMMRIAQEKHKLYTVKIEKQEMDNKG